MINTLKDFANLKHIYNLIQTKLWLKVIVGLVLGIIVGLLMGRDLNFISSQTATTVASWLVLPGKIFLILIQMIIIPLIFASVIQGITSSGNAEYLKKVGAGIALYFIFTTAISISLGIGISYIIKPGNYVDKSLIPKVKATQTKNIEQVSQSTGTTLQELPQQLTSILPSNPLESMLKGEMFQVVIFALILGVALIALSKDESAPLLTLLGSLQTVCMAVVKWAMKLAPFAVFGFLADITSRVGLNVLTGMLVYVGTVLLSLLAIIGFYTFLLVVFAKKNPLVFAKKIKDVQLLAFSTSSSASVMPLSLKTADNELGISPKVSKFIIPLGATVNMDGTAVYQGVATVFLAQVYDIHLSLSQLFLVVITVVGASIGSPGTPGVGIVILSSVLTSIGIPPSGVALIMGVDRILDMARTAVNVTGDLTASSVMDKWFGKDFQSTEDLQQ